MFIDFDSNSIVGGFRNLTGEQSSKIDKLHADNIVSQRKMSLWQDELRKCRSSSRNRRKDKYGNPAANCNNATFDVEGTGKKRIVSTISWFKAQIKKNNDKIAGIKSAAAKADAKANADAEKAAAKAAADAAKAAADAANDNGSGGNGSGSGGSSSSGSNVIKYAGIGIGVLLVGFIVYKVATRKK